VSLEQFLTNVELVLMALLAVFSILTHRARNPLSDVQHVEGNVRPAHWAVRAKLTQIVFMTFAREEFAPAPPNLAHLPVLVMEPALTWTQTNSPLHLQNVVC